jgi:hypothetical protein
LCGTNPKEFDNSWEDSAVEVGSLPSTISEELDQCSEGTAVQEETPEKDQIKTYTLVKEHTRDVKEFPRSGKLMRKEWFW